MNATTWIFVTGQETATPILKHQGQIAETVPIPPAQIRIPVTSTAYVSPIMRQQLLSAGLQVPTNVTRMNTATARESVLLILFNHQEQIVVSQRQPAQVRIPATAPEAVFLITLYQELSAALQQMNVMKMENVTAQEPAIRDSLNPETHHAVMQIQPQIVIYQTVVTVPEPALKIQKQNLHHAV
jgi:hypothetical protein